MAYQHSRKNWLGVAKEATAGVPVSPSVYVPFVTCELSGKQEPLPDDQAQGIREQQRGSEKGPLHGEGSISVYPDPDQLGYFLVAGVGEESTADLGSGAYRHTFSVNSSNTPVTLSLNYDRGNDHELYTYSTIDTSEFKFADGLLEATFEVMSRFPVATTSGTNSQTSSRLWKFSDATVKFGDTVADAEAASSIKVSEVVISLANNSEMLHQSGDLDVRDIVGKDFTASGSFKVLFENETYKDYNYDHTKKAMVVELTNNNSIGSGEFNRLKFRFSQCRFDADEFETSNGDLVAENVTFTGEYDVTDSKVLDVQLTNETASY